MNYILVTGCRHSGTSLLTSILGSHSKIAMHYEVLDSSWLKAYGKEIAGNKLLLHDQVRMYERANKFGYLMNRISNRFRSIVVRPYPTSKSSLLDYIEMGAKIIIIQRNQLHNINSVVERVKCPLPDAKFLYEQCEKIIMELSEYDCVYRLNYEDLDAYPYKTVKALLTWIGIDYEGDILERGIKNNWKYPQ